MRRRGMMQLQIVQGARGIQARRFHPRQRPDSQARETVSVISPSSLAGAFYARPEGRDNLLFGIFREFAVLIGSHLFSEPLHPLARAFRSITIFGVSQRGALS